MDAQSIVQAAQIVLIAIFILVCVNLYLVFRLKDVDPFRRWNANAINGWLFLIFMVAGLAAAFISNAEYKEYYTLLYNPASEHGVEIDRMMWNTMYVSLFASVITNILLFYFSWRYRHRKNEKALYYPHNNKLEVIWTVVPAVVLSLLIFDGVGVWHDIWADPEEGEDLVHIEVNGKQFAWTVRYPGEDLEYGETNVAFINEATGNNLGFNLNDKRGYDDVVSQEIHVPVNKKVMMTIRSRDVLHSATIAHFRVKMDAVPGMPTEFPFRPTITTEDYRKKYGKDDDFNFEMSCQQICGAAHWNMRLVVIVESEEDYQAWLAQQKTFYAQYQELNGLEDNTAEAQEAEEVQEEAEGVAMR